MVRSNNTKNGSNIDETNPITRRDIIQGMSTTASIGVIGAITSQSAAADGGVLSNITELDDESSGNQLRIAKSNSNYHKSVDDLQNRGFQISNENVYEVDGKEKIDYIASIKFIDSYNDDSGDQRTADLAVPIKDHTPISYKINIIDKNNGNKEFISITRSESDYEEESTTVDLDEQTSDQVTTSVSGCDLCHSVVSVTCSMSCALAPGVICTFVGGLWAGSACAIAADGVCSSLQELREQQGLAPCQQGDAAWLLCEQEGNC